MTPNTITELAEDYASLLASTTPPHPHTIAAWHDLGRYVTLQADTIRSDVYVTITPNPEPYATAADQAADLRQGRLVISSAHCDHPVWSPATNIAYRIVHDVYGHGLDGAPFTVAGELEAWSRQLRIMQHHRTPEPVVAAAFTETVGQLSYAAVHGGFPAVQRIGFMVAFPTAPTIDDREDTTR